MSHPLMPKATAVWLIDHTTLSFEQIADFCGLHKLEVQGIADGEVAQSVMGVDPVVAKQLTRAEIERCEKDTSTRLQLTQSAQEHNAKKKKKTSRYTPVARRQDKPDAIAWFIKHAPEVSDTQISKLIGTTKKTITSVRDKSHWNSSNIKPRDPVLLGLCTQSILNKALDKASPKQASE